MSIENIIEKIKKEPGCSLLPTSGQPSLVADSERLPNDLERFYSLCGGADLFLSCDFGFRVLSPNELKPANPILKDFLYEEMRDVFDNDISSHWYLLFTLAGPEENIVIDLGLERNGICYEGYSSNYATCDMKIIACSFSEVLEKVLASKGKTLWWDKSNHGGYIYESLGMEPPCG